MYLISNPRVPMTKGKFGAQAAHAAVEAYVSSPDNWLKHNWLHCGKCYAKVVLQADDLFVAQRYIEDRGFPTHMIIDEGRTEFDAALTPTFLGVQIVDKDNPHVRATFGAFKLYKDPSYEPGLIPSRLETTETVKRTMFTQEWEDKWLGGPEEKRTVKDWLKERFGHGNTTQRDS